MLTAEEVAAQRAEVAARNRPTMEGAQRHLELMRIRKIHNEFQSIADKAEKEGIDVPTKLKKLGFDQPEDFYLNCARFKLTDRAIDLGELGAGYVCFFDLFKCVGGFLLFFLVVNCVVMFKTYNVETEAKEKENQKTWIDLYKNDAQNIEILDAAWRTPGCLGYHGLNSWWPIGMYGVIFVVGVIGLAIYRERQKSLNVYVDAKTVAPNDFAILVRGLPTEGKAGTDEGEIKQFFEDHAFPGDKKPEIVKVVIGWDMKQYNEFKEERNQIIKKIAAFQKAGYDENHPQIMSQRVKIGDITKKLMSVALDTATLMKSSGAAVVIFRHQAEHRECLKRWDSFAVRMLTFFAIPHTLPQYQGKYTLNVIRAPNPTDIHWEDLAQTRRERWKRALVTWAVMFAVLISAGVGFYYLEQWRRDIRESQIGCKARNDCVGKWNARALGILVPLLTALINVVLMTVARWLAVKEYHDTVADRESSLIWKMSLVLVFSTVLMQYVVRMSPKEWYLKSGLAWDVFLLLLFNSLLSPIILVVDIGFRVKQKLVKRINVETTKLPKEKYYKYYEPSELNLPRQYAVMIKTLTLSTFYMPLLPWAPALGAIGIIIQYWAVKYMVVRKYKRPVATAGFSSASSAWKAVCVYVLLSVVLGHYIFLKASYEPSTTKSNLLLAVFVLTLLTAIVLFFLPGFIRRCLCCFTLCYGASDTADTATETDFYIAQHLWTKDRKYQKVQPLYKNLPERLNPTNFESNDTLNQEDVQGHMASALAENAKEDEEKDETGEAPGWQFMAEANRAKGPAAQWHKVVTAGQTVTTSDGHQVVVAAPPVVHTPSGTPVVVASVESHDAEMGAAAGATEADYSPSHTNRPLEQQPVQTAIQQPVHPAIQQPVQPMQQPVQPMQQPVQQMQQPVQQMQQPVQPVQQPLQPMMQPAQPMMQPVQPMMQPVQPMMQPVQPMMQPVQPMQQPVQQMQQPLQPVQQPVQPMMQPVQPMMQPVQPIQYGNACIGGCGRPIRPGYMKNGQPYGACCRGCARSRGQKHDHSCGR